MKKLYYTLVLALVLISSTLQAQTWSKLTVDFDSNFYDVSFVNTNVGYVSGDNGQVFKTTNGGFSWTRQNTGVSEGLASIQFLNENVGYAASGFFQDYATIVKTVNGGFSWSKANLPSNKTGGGMWFINQNVGLYAYADSLYGTSTIVRTTNGGDTWTQVYLGEGWISYFSFPTETVGYATVNNGTILKTTDGGASWNVLNLGSILWGSGISFYSENVGLVGGQPKSGSKTTIYTTTNGGSSWNPIETNGMIFKIAHANVNNIYALSVDNLGKGFMIKSEDGGVTWDMDDVEETQLRGIQFVSSTIGYAVGAEGVIIKYAKNAAISKVDNVLNTTIFPNPASDFIYIRVNEYVGSNNQMNIYNCNGELVCTKNLLFALQDVDVSDLNQGVYFVQIVNEKSSEWHKIWVVR